MSKARNWLRKTKRHSRKFGLCDRCGKPFSSFSAVYVVYKFPHDRERCHWNCIEIGEGIAYQESDTHHMLPEYWRENKK